MPFDIVKLIASYMVENHYKFLDWIDKDKINWNILGGQPKARNILEQNLHKVFNWNILSENPNIIDNILIHNIDTICWKTLSANSGAIELLAKYPERIN